MEPFEAVFQLGVGQGWGWSCRPGTGSVKAAGLVEGCLILELFNHTLDNIKPQGRGKSPSVQLGQCLIRAHLHFLFSASLSGRGIPSTTTSLCSHG